MDMTELSANPPSDPLDPDSTPADENGNFVADHEEPIEKATIEDPVIQGVVAVLASGLVITLIMAWTLFSSGRGKQREYESMLLMVEEAEGYAGLASAEQELDKMLESNLLGAGQGLLLKDRLESKRFALEDDLSGAGSHPSGTSQSDDTDLAMITEHGNVATWGSDQSQWSPEQQAWYAQAKQWGGYYDASGNWVPIQ